MGTDRRGPRAGGKRKLGPVAPVGDVDENGLVGLAATLERGSGHPLAAAIVNGATARGVAVATAESFESLTGRGVTGKVRGRSVALGNAKLLEQLGIASGVAAGRADALRSDGETVLYIAVDGRLAGPVCVVRPLRDTTPEALRHPRA